MKISFLPSSLRHLLAAGGVLLFASAAPATPVSYSLDDTITSTSDTSFGIWQISPSSISVGDLYRVLFTVDGTATSSSADSLIFNTPVTSLQILRDPSNTGTYQPTWTLFDSQITFADDEGGTIMSVVFAFTGGNDVAYTSTLDTDPAAFYEFELDFRTSQAFVTAPAGTSYSSYVANYLSQPGNWATQKATMTFGQSLSFSPNAQGNVTDAVPEPGTWALLTAGALFVGFRLRSRLSGAR